MGPECGAAPGPPLPRSPGRSLVPVGNLLAAVTSAVPSPVTQTSLSQTLVEPIPESPTTIEASPAESPTSGIPGGREVFLACGLLQEELADLEELQMALSSPKYLMQPVVKVGRMAFG